MACNPCPACPSCRLAVSSKTGRLRWCVAERKGQRRLLWVLTACVLALAVATVAAAIVLRLAGICIDNKNADAEPTGATSPFRAEGPFDTEAEGEAAQDRSILMDSNVWYLPRASAADYAGVPAAPQRPGDRAGGRRRRTAPETVPEPEPDGQQPTTVTWQAVTNASSAAAEESQTSPTQPLQWHTVKPSEDAQWAVPPRKGSAAAASGEDGAKDEKAPGQPAGSWGPYAAQQYTAGQVVAELDANDLAPDSKASKASKASQTSNGTLSGAVRQVWRALDQYAHAHNATGGGGDPAGDHGDLFWDIWMGQDDPSKVREARARMMKQYMDQSVDPCTDFYAYACGGWASAHPVPPDKSVFDMFETLREMLDAALRAELDEPDARPTPPPPPPRPSSGPSPSPSSRPPPTTAPTGPAASAAAASTVPLQQQAAEASSSTVSLASDGVSAAGPASAKAQWATDGGDPASDSGAGRRRSSTSATPDATTKAKWLYQSCMNHELLEARGVAPLLDLLKSLGGWPVLDPGWEDGDGQHFDWLALVAELRLYNNDILIAEWVGPDVKDSDQYVIQLDQTGLGLPTRDYFLVASNAPYLRAYREFLVEVMVLLGAEAGRAARHADELVAFETSLAEIVSSSDERRNVSQLYRRLSVRELCASVPAIDWRRYLAAVLGRPVRDHDPVVVFALRYMNDLAALLDRAPKRVVADYLLWRFVRHRVNSLGERFVAAKQRLLHALMGREAVPQRWKTCVAHVNSHMGMALGALFVRKYFDHNSKQDTLEMTREITQSFREMLNETRWIDEETRRLALHKVDAMQLRIGYPDFILDRDALNERYEDVDIHPERYFENTLNILRKLAVVEQERLGTAVNKTLWNTAPAVVNAYYSRNKNQIMFPAGILQPPFYHRHLPRSLNYGGIGVVIGHEVTHGFDDKGRLFNEHGRLMRWWSEDAIYNFHQRARCLINQYGKYSVSELDQLINGENTQGENIADNGGIKQAFRAYERWLAQHGEAGETLPGVNATCRQLFFINFAQVWCSSMRPEAMRIKLKIAVHSPARFRVIGTLSNSKEFADVFQCPAGSPMNPSDKCSVW